MSRKQAKITPIFYGEVQRIVAVRIKILYDTVGTGLSLPCVKGVGCRKATRRDCKIVFIWFYDNPSVVINDDSSLYTREPISGSRKGCPYGDIQIENYAQI